MNLFGKVITSQIEVLPLELQTACRKVITEMEEFSSQSSSKDQFCENVVESIHHAFNLYSANLYIIEAKDGLAVLKAGTSKIAKEAKQKNHKLPIDGNSLIGMTLQTGQGRIMQENQVEINYYPSPTFPPVHSELALPIILPRDKMTIGVLDIQSDECEAFGTNEYAAFSVIANCLALVFNDAFSGRQSL
jgi:transcriptional regulator with GAF, ATPase, and Fis domain